MGIFKSAKKLVTGSESAKDAFTDCEKLYDEIDDYSFMPFDMIMNTCEAIDTLLAQREDMIALGLMKERVADIDRDMTRARAALKDLKKAHPEAHPEETLNPMVKCFGRCGVGGFTTYPMQKLACFDTLTRSIHKIIQDSLCSAVRCSPCCCRSILLTRWASASQV